MPRFSTLAGFQRFILSPREWNPAGRTIGSFTETWIYTDRLIQFRLKSRSSKNGLYEGTAVLKQSAFGIAPVRIAGGTVKLKDEVKIAFSIALLN